MAYHQNSIDAKKRILTVCVKLFIEKGFRRTTLSEIIANTGVSCSTFQNLFHTKDGVLLELTQIMFDSQFDAARLIGSKAVNPIFVYAVETAIQLTLTELNENLREIYVEAYSNSEACEYIYKRTSKELERIFSHYNPDCTGSDFYELEIGSAGIMRNYMAKRCDQYFTLEKKLERFITMSLKAYNVPNAEIAEAVSFVLGIDIKSVSNRIMHALFESLAMRFCFELGEEN